MPMATGIMIAIMDIGPRPGNMPIKVPMTHPITTMIKLNGVTAADNPIRIPSSTFSAPLHEHERPRAEENPKHLLDQIPDRPGGDDRHRDQDVKSTLSENDSPDDEKTNG